MSKVFNYMDTMEGECTVKLSILPLVSVIVPIYNTEKYLRQCLDSVINQTYKNLEIILVDDGSTDGSSEIAAAYVGHDHRVILVQQRNMGESNARNVGLKMATGDYIAFLDCDDWIDCDMYQTLISEAKRHDLDIVAASWYQSTAQGDTAVRNLLPAADGVFARDEFLLYLYKRDAHRGFAYMWDKVYKREILLEGQNKPLRFDEGLRLGGDVLFLAEAALRAKRIKYVDVPFYHYRQRINSGCRTTDLSKLREWVRAYEKILVRFSVENVPAMVIGYVKRFLAYHSCMAAKEAVAQNNQDWKVEFQSLMRQYEKEYSDLNQEHPERIEDYRKILAG